MKKVLVLVVAAVLVAVGGFLVFNQKTLLTTTSDISKVIPDGALVYIRFSNIKKNVDEFTATKFWQDLKTINLKQAMGEAGASPQQLAEYESLKTNLTEGYQNLMASQFFGQEAALAVYPVANLDFDNVDEKIARDLLGSLVLVVRITAQAQMAELVSGFSKHFSKDFTSEELKHKNQSYTRIKSADSTVSLHYAKFGDLLIVSFNEEAVKQSIDVHAKSRKALFQDPGYQKVHPKFLPSSDIVFYGNYDTFVSGIRSQILKMTEDAKAKNPQVAQQTQEKMDEAFNQMKGFTWFGYSYLPGRPLKQNFVLFYDPAKIDPYLKEAYSCAPAANTTANFIPNEAVVYQWNNCFDLTAYWNKVKEEWAKEVKSDPSAAQEFSPEKLVETIKNATGLNLETEILPILGTEYGGYFSDINVSGIFPIPKFVLFLKVTDQNKAEALMQKVFNLPILTMQVEIYQGHQIQYASLPIGTDLQPGYTFVNKYLLLGTSRELLKDSIDAFGQPAQSIAAHPDFKASLGEGAKSGVFFVKIDALSRNVRQLVEWGNKWATLKLNQAKAIEEGRRKRFEDVKAMIVKDEEDVKNFTAQLESLNASLVEAKVQAAAQPVVPPQLAPAVLPADTGVLVSPPPAVPVPLPAPDPVAELTKQIENVEAQKKAKEVDLKSNQELRDELESYIAEAAKVSVPMDAKRLQSILEGVVYPALKAAESIHTIGSSMIMESGAIETMSYTTME